MLSVKVLPDGGNCSSQRSRTQTKDEIFCPELVSGQRIRVIPLLSATREQSAHSAQMILIIRSNELRPGLDRTEFGVGVTAVERLKISCRLALKIFGRRNVIPHVELRTNLDQLFGRYGAAIVLLRV